MSRCISLCLVILSVSLFSAPASARAASFQGSDTAARMLAAINAARVANGLPPYALNSLLTLSAQRHSEYQRDIGYFTHEGPGGTRTVDRALAVGYPAIRANENVYAGSSTPEEVVEWWLTADEAHRHNILHPVLREVGIGAASDANGVIYYTLDISAQPNVLPIFINSDAYLTSTPTVTLTLTNEEVFSSAAGQIGYATQIMVSNTPDFAGATPQPWAQYVDWMLDTSAGEGFKTVYVRFIDAAGRSADSQDSIVLDTSGAGVVVPTTPPTLIPQPTAAPQPVVPLPQPTPALSGEATATPVSETPSPAATPTLYGRPIVTAAVLTSASVSAVPTTLLGLRLGLIRTILIGTLGTGLGLIVLGSTALLRLRRVKHEREIDAED